MDALNTFDFHLDHGPREDKDGRWSLNDLHKMAGSPIHKEPSEWVRQDGTKSLMEVLQDQRLLTPVQNRSMEVLKTKQGKGGGTWAVRGLALAYAKYLDPVFHAACLRVIEDRYDEMKDPELGITRANERATKSWLRAGKDQAWVGIRKEGIATRKEFTAACAKRGCKDFRTQTNAIYLGVYNMTATQLREKHNLEKGANVRDSMGETALIMVRLAENLAATKAENENLYGDQEIASASHHCARSIHAAVVGALKVQND